MDLKARLADELDAARRRSIALLEPVPEPELVRQHSPLMSPLAWDLAHVGNYEDLWLVRAVGGDAVGATYDHLYDAFRNPRADRPSLPLLGPAEARAYLASVRGRALDHLERAELDPESPLLDRGFVYGMVVQHEHQHDETMLATLQLMEGRGYRPVPAPMPPGPPRAGSGPALSEEVVVDGGPFTMGTDDEAWAYDNERPAHVVDLAPFRIDAHPTTNAAFTEFVEAGGYHERRWWSDAGWAWRTEAGLEHPQFWTAQGAGSWSRVRFGWHEDLPADEPVQHVCWYEADAYARWRGKRLPTEAEWEKAASWDPATGTKRRYPWGDGPPSDGQANLGQVRFGPAPVGSFPAGASPWGCQQMVGDVWEWTASDFRPHPGFRAFPYREYSEVFWGPAHKVLRGGSWATSPSAVRTTFRNWDLPVRRQIFAGVRCARDL
ncbi:MAG: ergothioneine biosynthesis protein EgtB [Actinobacteria bacterium]|nr:ergothioneine biosynthesis protein EgtB [Actinomycetota bacterium]